MAERFIDFAAAGRVASRVELKSIRVTDVSAKCDPKVVGALEPTLELECEAIGREVNTLDIICNYRFIARIAETQVAEATIRYLLAYEVQGSEPLIQDDMSEFATSNGTLHSWPFVREFLYGLTSRMGYPPYTLPVFHFKPKPHETRKAEEKMATTKIPGEPK